LKKKSLKLFLKDVGHIYIIKRISPLSGIVNQHAIVMEVVVAAVVCGGGDDDDDDYYEDYDDDDDHSHVRLVACHYSMSRPQVADGGDGLQIWKVAANMLNKKSGLQLSDRKSGRKPQMGALYKDKLAN
jgi:hypothetical protein